MPDESYSVEGHFVFSPFVLRAWVAARTRSVSLFHAFVFVLAFVSIVFPRRLFGPRRAFRLEQREEASPVKYRAARPQMRSQPVLLAPHLSPAAGTTIPRHGSAPSSSSPIARAISRVASASRSASAQHPQPLPPGGRDKPDSAQSSHRPGLCPAKGRRNTGTVPTRPLPFPA